MKTCSIHMLGFFTVHSCLTVGIKPNYMSLIKAGVLSEPGARGPYMTLILPAIQIHSRAHKHTRPHSSPTIPLLGVPLINELQVQRCVYARVWSHVRASISVSWQKDIRKSNMARLVCARGLCTRMLGRQTELNRREAFSTFLSVHLFYLTNTHKELF